MISHHGIGRFSAWGRTLAIVGMWLVAASTAIGQTYSPQFLPTGPWASASAAAISGGGQVVVGAVWTASQAHSEAVLWRNGVLTSLHPPGFLNSNCYGVSKDGSMQVGGGELPGHLGRALMWEGSAGTVRDLTPSEVTSCYLLGISDDGSSQLGWGEVCNQYTCGSIYARLWSGTPQSAQILRQWYNITYAGGISGDGRTQVGTSYDNNSHYRAVAWFGSLEGTVLHAAPYAWTFANATSYDGSIQVGQGRLPDGLTPYRALVWHSTPESVQELLPSGFSDSDALAISRDGRFVVGFAWNIIGGGDYPEAVVWDLTTGASLNLHDFLPAQFTSSTGLRWSQAVGVDDAGNVLGNAYDFSTDRSMPLVWRRSGAPSVQPLVASPTAVPANNAATSSLTLHYRQPNGTPIPDRLIRFSSNRSGDSFSSTTATTDSDGEASVTVRSGVAGVSTYTCRDMTVGQDIPASAQVTFFSPGSMPVIESVQRSLRDGAFLKSIPMNNTVTVRVADWRGAPGRVEFSLNGAPRVVQATGNSVGTTYNMGTDLLYSLEGRWNELRITAFNAAGVPSVSKIVRWCGVALPPAIQPAFWVPLPGSNPKVEISVDGKLKATFLLKWPQEPTNAATHVQAPFPLMGDKVWGKENATFDVELALVLEPISYPRETLRGSAVLTAGATIANKYSRNGQMPVHRVSVASLTWDVRGSVAGTFDFVPKFGLRQLELRMDSDIGFDTPDILPMIPALQVFAPVLDLYGHFVASANGSAVFSDLTGTFGYRDSSFTLGISGSVVLALDREFSRFVSAGIEGGLKPSTMLQLPGNAANANNFNGVPFIHQVALDIFLNGFIDVNLWWLDYHFHFEALNAHYAYPNQGNRPEKSGSGKAKSRWSAPNRSYLATYGKYHQLVHEGAKYPFPPKGQNGAEDADDWDVREQRLIANTFPYAHPALAYSDGMAVILYSWDRPSLPSHQSTEVRSLIETPSGWEDIEVTNDTALDSQPQVAVDSLGRIVAVWTRIETALPNEQPSGRIPKSEIAYSVFDPGTRTWSAPALMTTDQQMDFNPTLAKGADGQLYLTWLKSPDNVFPTEFENPIVPHTDIFVARWDGAQFVDASRAVPRANTQEYVGTAITTTSSPMLVWSVDADANTATHDGRLMFSYWNGTGWTSPSLVPETDTLTNGSPALNMGLGDVPALFFVRSDVPYPQQPEHTVEKLYVKTYQQGAWSSALEVAVADRLSDIGVVATPDGKVSAIWSASSANTVDLWTTVFDPITQTYGAPVRLTDDPGHELQVSPAWDPLGNPSAVFIRRTLTAEDRVVRDGLGNPYTLPVLVPGAADLYLLNHRPRPDLALGDEDVLLDPANAGPGANVTMTASVHNLRALGAGDVRVGFYDGDPGAGGALIGIVALTPNPLPGGGSGTASMNWTVPNDGMVHTVYAKADPEGLITETDEGNNTGSYKLLQLDFAAIAPSVRQYLPDGKVLLNFGVKNPSTVSVLGTVTYQLWKGDAGTGELLTTGTLTAPSPGQEALGNFAWEPGGIAPGAYELTLVIDPEDEFPNEDPENNTASGQVLLLADLAINLADATLDIGEGRIGIAGVTVLNLGWTGAQNVQVEVFDRDPSIQKARLLGSTVVADLPRGGDARVLIPVELPAPFGQSGDLWVVVNREGAIPEVRSDNNYLLFSLAPYFLFPATAEVRVGQLVSGGLPELTSSDDTYVVVSPDAAGRVQLEVSAVSPQVHPGNLEFHLEGHATGSSLELTVELFDSAIGQWVAFETWPSPTEDQSFLISLRNSGPDHFVDPVSHQMRARITWSPVGAPTQGWVARIDRAVWRIWP